MHRCVGLKHAHVLRFGVILVYVRIVLGNRYEHVMLSIVMSGIQGQVCVSNMWKQGVAMVVVC